MIFRRVLNCLAFALNGMEAWRGRQGRFRRNADMASTPHHGAAQFVTREIAAVRMPRGRTPLPSRADMRRGRS